MGGVRGFQNSFLVDGTDDNNSFFAQARGRYRAPYQFSNEVIQEFRVSKNSYSAELGRSGGAVFNVVTKSGTNHWHGSGFYFLRDRQFDAQQPYADSKPDDRQQQFGGTIGGPLRKDRVFFYAGFDQHLLTVPSIVQFGNGASTVVPQPTDYDYTDRPMVFAAAQKLNSMGGVYPTTMQGNAGFAKVDFNLIVQATGIRAGQHVNADGHQQRLLRPVQPDYRLCGQRERYRGCPDRERRGGPGQLLEPEPRHQSAARSSRAICSSRSPTPMSRGPRSTTWWTASAGPAFCRARPASSKLHVADTVSYEHGRMHWKFGGDFIQAWIYNYYPYLFGGEYYFDNVKVNPWTYAPEHMASR